MKKLSIFEVCVAMQDQSQCNRMKAVCLDNGLSIWEDEDAFLYTNKKCNLTYFNNCAEFWITSNDVSSKTQVTEAEFIELLKEYKLNE